MSVVHTARRATLAGASVLGWYVVPAIVVGGALATGRIDVALLLVLGVIGLLLLPRLSLAGWCGVLMISTVAARGLVLTAGLPGIVSFLHYPVALLFAAVAAMRPRGGDATTTRRAGRWLVGFVLLSALSLVANLSHPLRGVIFLLITGEPLLIIWAMLRWGPDTQTMKELAILAAVLLLVQIPIALFQAFTIGPADHVQGTLVGHGAGAHVLGGLFALGMLLTISAVIAGRASAATGVVVSLATVFMIFLANATQVLIALGVALLPLPLIVRRMSGGTTRTRLAGVAAGVLVAATTIGYSLYLINTTLPGTFSRAQRVATPEELPEREILEGRLKEAPLTVVLGSGPGTSASRAALLLSPEYKKETSPLASLDLPPTEAAQQIVRSTRSGSGGSAESFASSALAIIGDLGLLGLAGTVLLFVGIWRHTAHGDNWISPAVRAALIMVTVLSFVDNWLEYPEFSVPLAILVAFGLQRTPRREPAHKPIPASPGDLSY